MKNILLKPFISLCLIYLSSCQKNADYYDVRDEYAGDYSVTDIINSDTSYYSLTIFKSDYDDQIIFGVPGLYQTGFEVYAIVTGMKIIIPIQDYSVSAYPDIYYEFSGSGSLQDSILTVDYRVLTVQDGLITNDVDSRAFLKK